MASKSEFVRARIHPDLKADAEAIMDRLGLNTSDVIRTLYKQIVLRGGIPFELKIPDAESMASADGANDGEAGWSASLDDGFRAMR